MCCGSGLLITHQLLLCHLSVAAELLCFLRDTVDTRKPPLMEIALDCIQKMVSFKLLQGPVHHINHRCAAGRHGTARRQFPSLTCFWPLVGVIAMLSTPRCASCRRDGSSRKEDEGEKDGPALDFESLPPQVCGSWECASWLGTSTGIPQRRRAYLLCEQEWLATSCARFACSSSALPQAQAVELVCRCDDVSDDAVELRLLKALLTAVTSTTLAVHGQALLLVVRACYNIFLTSRSDVNQATAKATLTQVGFPRGQRPRRQRCRLNRLTK